MRNAIRIVDELFPELDSEEACILVQSAAAGLLGIPLRQIRVGAIYWPDRLLLTIGAAGWGVMGNGRDFHFEDTVCDEDGSFNGHTWIETDSGFVIDALYEVDCELPTLADDSGSVLRAYFRRPPLERTVKRFWREKMKMARRAGRLSRKP